MPSTERGDKVSGRTTNDLVLVVNSGSSSIKFALYRSDLDVLYRGQVEQIGVSPRLIVKDAAGKQVLEKKWPSKDFDHNAAVREILQVTVALKQDAPVAAVGHRVVHGGARFSEPVRVDGAIIDALAELTPLAPLHQPHNLAPITAITKLAPHIPQVACFDTGFHHGQSRLAQLYALPRKLTDAGIRRYGFHGLSYEFIVSKFKEMAPDRADGRLAIAHLGNGASLCGVHRGRSVTSTMGFTSVDGLMMGTRCGAIDPGVIIYLMDSFAMDARAIEKLVYRESGLLGVSGVSSDMRKLRASTEPAASEAIALFIYRVVRELGSIAAALGGLDTLIFTGGIGEHDEDVRAEVGQGSRWLGVELDQNLNRTGTGCISSSSSRVSTWVIPTDEERMIAQHTRRVLGCS